jgi:hypothetical protein
VTLSLHLGDIIVEDDDIHGDGVNVAARLEDLAGPGGVRVSGTVGDHIGDRLDLTFDDMGEHSLKDIARPLLENRRLQRTQKREVRLPLLSIFKPAVPLNTLTACWWMTSLFIVAYMILVFPTYLQRDLHLSPALVALPVMLQNAAIFFRACSGALLRNVSGDVGR